METKYKPLECGCCNVREFTISENEMLKDVQFGFLLDVLKAIEENPRKNPLRFVNRALTLLELRTLQKRLSALKEGIK